MIPYTYPSSVSGTTGRVQCIVYYLPSVAGLTRWVDYIPVKQVGGTPVEGTTDANGYQAVVSIGSTTGLVPYKDYIPVYEDAAATVAWGTGSNGYIPVGASGGTVPLRFATNVNYLPTTGTTADATYKNVRFRMAFRIGSGNLSQLILSLNGWFTNGSGATSNPNAFDVVKLAIEKSGGVTVPVTFSGGRTKTINPGDTDIQSDPILPGSFGIGSFTQGDLYYIRGEYQVANSTDTFPQGPINYNNHGYPASVGLKITTGNDVSAVDATGTMTFSTGWANFAQPCVPIVLGRATSGDLKTFILVGDSIISGQGDTNQTNQGGTSSGAGRALVATDFVTNPLGGLNAGIAGVTASVWNNGTSSRLIAYLKYAKYLVEEFGTNEYLSAPGTAPATVVASSKVIWDAAAAVGTSTLRVKLLPRTTADGTTALNSAWQTGGNARAFNSLLESTGGITLITRNSLRAGSTEGTDAFYQWVGGATNTGDGTHPNSTGYLLDAADFRAAYAAAP